MSDLPDQGVPAAEIEARLRAHAAVSGIAVVDSKPESGHGRRVYVVPAESYFDTLLAEQGGEHRRVQRWRKTFDLSQMARQVDQPEAGGNFAGWTSSYTRQAIPADQMREWVETTITEIRLLQPDRVLEIGCGSGLLLFRLAPHCSRYAATDFAPAVLKQLKRQMSEAPGRWSNVEVLERSAENFEGFDHASFDTVILNSVVQYFPSAKYLQRVVEQAAQVAAPGGRIFIGDVRNLALLEACAVSVELYQAPASMQVAELRERVQRRMLFDDELVISPSFFLTLKQLLPEISRVEIRPRLGRFHNELTRFRYNAILHVKEGSQPEPIRPRWVDWREEKPSAEAIAAMLKIRPQRLAIREIGNARLEAEVRAQAALSHWGGGGTVEQLRSAVQPRTFAGVDPHAVWSLGTELGYRVELNWSGGRRDGSYNAVFCREARDRAAIQWPAPDQGDRLPLATTVPGRGGLREILAVRLAEYVRECFPQDAIPTQIVMVDAIPTQPNGEIDQSALAGLAG